MKKLLCLLLVTWVFLSGCSNTNTSQYSDGTYKSSSQGYGGLIDVETKIEKGKITDIKVVADKETDNIGGTAIEQLKEKALKINSAELDVISQATYTSEAFIEALNNTLSQASGEEIVSGTVKNGKYVTEVIGHEGTMKVATTFIDGAISNVQVLLHGETQGIGSYAVDRIPAKIVEHQSIAVDAIGGATISSNVIKQAVSDAIVKAGGNLKDYNNEIIEQEIVKETINEDVSVVIMGAGTAGLFAATKLIEEGIDDIIIFEKQEIPGGTMATAYGGVVVSDSEVFNNWGMGNPIYSTWDIMLPAFEKGLVAQGKEYTPGLPFSEKIFKTSGKVFDWMVNNGIGYNTLGSKPGYTYPYLSPGAYEGGAGFAMEFLVKRLEKNGVRIIYETPVTEFKSNESGDITGVIAVGADGKTWDVNSDALLVASGSFAKNKELVSEYFPDWQNNYFNTIETVTGDGLLLAMEHGAGIDGMGGYMPGFMSSYDSKFELAFMHLTTPGMIVNVNGDEFGDHIARNHESMAAAKADPANGDTFYYIFDDSAAILTEESSRFGFDTYKAIFEKGEAVRYNSVEEASQDLNLPNLQASLDKNNELALKGESNEFGRKNLPYMEISSGIWAIRVDPNVYLTTGGIDIDLDARVLTKDSSVIKGLYAAGDVCGSIEAKDGRHYAYGFNSAMAYGTIAAETIIKDYNLN